MSDTILLVAGCLVFAIVTVATLLYGYMVLNRVWQADERTSVRGPATVPLMVPVTIPVPD
ncbi:MAG: hypothetical protein OEY41_04930 [Acidimicrobiia bacterium]|nr:hypothetical protein [Acidimicrobiia bacterium]MDH4363113.1 hypothetical protein [Acidimicrobiia bacterium]MDH5289324.1 hypothetical protein [Acidimicrobiia bacterium]